MQQCSTRVLSTVKSTPSLTSVRTFSTCLPYRSSTSSPPGPSFSPTTSPTRSSHSHHLRCSKPFAFSAASTTPLSPTRSRTCLYLPFSIFNRHASSKSRWTARQSTDPFTRAAKVAGLKSRAAFKLLQLNEKHHIFKPGQTVVDLGYAPGSWSQVAVDLTKPGGRVLGVDLIPAQPPRGVSTIQGDFLSEEVREGVKRWLGDGDRGRLKNPAVLVEKAVDGEEGKVSEGVLKDAGRSYVEEEREGSAHDGEEGDEEEMGETRNVDVVLSDMSAPWDLIDGLYKRSVSNPYYRLMNTSGNAFRDHAGSMDLCRAALQFSYDTLKIGGHFVCKFYQGAEDKMLEKSLKALFQKVHREKPESSRSESKESYFIGLKRLAKADKDVVFAEP